MDKYDIAVAYLREHPEEIPDAWNNPSGQVQGENRGEPLFGYVAPNPFRSIVDIGNGLIKCGCLTQVALGEEEAYTDDLTQKIRSDHRIPTKPEDITVNDLEVFAEWQRKIDKELNRK
jgi:hypothetical protein